jgi:aminoglycoside phosphotransferase
VSTGGVLERADFIRDTVWRRLDEGPEPPEVELVHHRHGILEYQFQGGRRVFAKPFSDHDKAFAAYEIQRALWEGGFGPGSGYRVPEPIAYLADERVILMGAAPGKRVRELAVGDRPTWEDALRCAARWLATLHSSSHRLGPPDDSTRRVLHLARRVAETAARRPDLEDMLGRLLDQLAERLPSRDRASEVQTHGRYHPQHVYVDSGAVTVIDADRATPGDPAKDIGEFLHRLRADARAAGLDAEAVDHASAAFVQEYESRSVTTLPGLEFYWSYSILFTLVARAGRTVSNDADAEQRIEFYEAELGGVPDRVAAYVSALGGRR